MLTQLQTQVATIASVVTGEVGVSKVEHNPDDINAPTTVISTDNPSTETTQGDGKQPNQLGSLLQIMQMIRGQGSGVDMDGLAKLVAQREALDRLIPPNPYEVLATKLGISVLDNFAKRMGVAAIDDMMKG